jgi:hypothetical protein
LHEKEDPEMPAPAWLLHDLLLERSTPVSGPSFADALRSAGCEATVFSVRGGALVPEGGSWPALSGRPVVSYGSHLFVREALKRADVRFPGAYRRLDDLSFHAFAAHLGDLVASDDYVILPFAELARRPAPGRAVFLRPDRVTKSFTGFTAEASDFAAEVSCLRTVRNVAPDELVVMASAREIVLECRFVVADGEVVAGSTYGWEDGFVPSTEIHAGCRDLAREVARRRWQADSVYVCDIGLVREGGTDRPRLIELNAFSCSGLYACDAKAVAEAVSRAAMDEFGASAG